MQIPRHDGSNIWRHLNRCIYMCVGGGRQAAMAFPRWRCAEGVDRCATWSTKVGHAYCRCSVVRNLDMVNKHMTICKHADCCTWSATICKHSWFHMCAQSQLAASHRRSLACCGIWKIPKARQPKLGEAILWCIAWYHSTPRLGWLRPAPRVLHSSASWRCGFFLSLWLCVVCLLCWDLHAYYFGAAEANTFG